MANEPEEFSIARVFHAPRELVFNAWTDAGQLEKWWGSKGANIKIQKLELQPGGLFLYSMQMPGADQKLWGRFVYQEIAPTSKLVFTSSFADENGNVVRAPFNNAWPLEILNTVNFNQTGGSTTVVVQGAPVNATEEEMQTFTSMFDSLQQGFTGTFDQLEEYLTTIIRNP